MSKINPSNLQNRKRYRDHESVNDDDSNSSVIITSNPKNNSRTGLTGQNKIIIFDDDNEDDDNEDDDNEDDDNNNENDDILTEFHTKYSEKKIETLQDLIHLAESYAPFINRRKKPRWNLDLRRLYNMLPSLIKLNRMIGMRELKRTIVHLIVYYLQDFESSNSNMLHTVIEGPPGTGKTEVAKIIGEIYLGLGILQNKTFRIVRRSDLIGGYLGQTAIKTQKVIDEARGGVLFIDEAYSLGNPEGRDSYSKECIDTLNQNLTENKANFICIIAGYPNSLKESFFSVNHGLERRFPFRFMIEEYMPEELREIFLKIVEDNLWTIFENNIIHNIPISFFETNKQYFIFNGGDMENLFQLVKISHSQRIYSLDSSVKKKITLTDLTNAFTLYLNNKNIKNRSEIHSVPPMMYL
jgi:hypothetical protein